MFNFFDELKKTTNFKPNEMGDYQIITISGKLLYVEGHKGLVMFSKEEIVFRVASGKISVQGSDLLLKELTDKTLCISGKIVKVEASQ